MTITTDTLATVTVDRPVAKMHNDASTILATENGSFSDCSGTSSPVVDTVYASSKKNVVENYKKLIELAENAYKDEKLFVAARLLHQVKDESLLTDLHYNILQLAQESQEVLADLVYCMNPDDDTDAGWIKQGENHGKYETNVYYKYPEGYLSSTITCRVETPIDTDLLIPLLSVLNESDLYKSWVPEWPSLRLGLRLSKQLKAMNRVNQVVCLYGNAPWPFTPRQMIARTIAIDETEADDDNYFLAVTLHNNTDETIVLPEETAGAVTCDVDGAFLFRPCPPDHPLLRKKSQEGHNNNNDDDEDWESLTPSNDKNNNDKVSESTTTTTTDDENSGSEEPKILVSFKLSLNPHMRGIPQSVVNFILRQAIGGVWYFLLKVAEQVRDGERPLHTDATVSKPEIYNFIQDRADCMINRMKREQQQQKQKQKQHTQQQ